MEKILVSSCLLGEQVRYNGGAATSDDPLLRRWQAEGRAVSFCPEVAGGLGTPRPRAERVGVRVLTEHGDLRAFRTYQKQPAHRDRPLEEQLHGFMWNRKQKYAVLLVQALDPERVPRPLDRVLAHV